MEPGNILAADIGGTNSRFAHFHSGRDGLSLVSVKWLATQSVGSFSELMETFWAEDFPLAQGEAEVSVIAIAGPVVGGTYSAPPAIPFEVDISGGLSGAGDCRMINDFVAQAYACLSPVAAKAEVVLEGSAEPGATIAVLGAGTGLGKAAIVPDGRGGYAAMASEGGHTAFPFTTPAEDEYRQFLLAETGSRYITPNMVVSGGGLSLLYRFLTGQGVPPEEVADKLLTNPEALSWAASFYGRVARDFALETLAMGGLYIAGGVAARTPGIVHHEAFKAEFTSSPSLSGVLEGIPVHLQPDQDSGLWGAAWLGASLLEGKGAG